jgi:hypothetical protein
MSRAKNRELVGKPFDLVEIENQAFHKLYVGPESSVELHKKVLLSNDRIQHARAKSQMKSPTVGLIS